MAVAAVPLMIASTAIQAVGAIRQGRAEKKAANYQKTVAQKNAKIAEENAVAAEEQIAEDAQDVSIEAADTIGQIVANAGASGLLLGGSTLLQIQYANKLAGRDQIRIRASGKAEADRIRQQKQDLLTEAKMARNRARSAGWSTFFNVGSTIIGGATSVARYKFGVS